MTGGRAPSGRCRSGEAGVPVLEPDSPASEGLPAEWVNAQEAIGQLRGDLQSYVEICGIFLQEAGHWQAQLPGLAAQDRAGFVATLHEVTNALPIVGARAAAQSLRRMEFTLRDDDRAPVGPTLQAALGIIAAVSEALRLQINQRRV